MLSRFAESQYADYQIYIPSDVQTIALRYAALGKAIVAIWIDDEPTAIASLAATGGMDEWTIAEIAASLKAGYHTLRLEMQEGVININWFKLN